MRRERVWAAGFFDGEGHTRASLCTPNGRGGSREYRTLNVTVRQTHREVLDRFAAAVGVGKVRGPYGPYQPRASAHYVFDAHGSDARAVLKAIRPYLSSVKKAQADLALSLLTQKTTRKRRVTRQK
jgi:hypothetical protein